MLANLSNYFNRNKTGNKDPDQENNSFDWLVDFCKFTVEKLSDESFVKFLALGIVGIGGVMLAITFLPMLIQAITMLFQSTIMLVSMATTLALSAVPLLLGTGLIIGGLALFGSALKEDPSCIQIGASLLDFLQKTDPGPVVKKLEGQTDQAQFFSMFLPILKNADKGFSYFADRISKKIGYEKGIEDLAQRIGQLFSPIAFFVHTQISPRVAYCVKQGSEHPNPVQVVIADQSLNFDHDEKMGCLHKIAHHK